MKYLQFLTPHEVAYIYQEREQNYIFKEITADSKEFKKKIFVAFASDTLPKTVTVAFEECKVHHQRKSFKK